MGIYEELDFSYSIDNQIGINLFLFGRWFIFEQAYEPSESEQAILSEMVQKTVESKEYIKLAEKENIILMQTWIKIKVECYPLFWSKRPY
ncbi:hypothetical protein SRABI133_04992 [Peribacillus simplex]|uniref:Uncharacterized protein n=1 Tax=Peribacillus simplex TaxID=1478 RepID=A0A9W4L709_9BACI|nr:hypothetical protein SRABI133_04992 [Peribacillus simplex]